MYVVGLSTDVDASNVTVTHYKKMMQFCVSSTLFSLAPTSCGDVTMQDVCTHQGSGGREGGGGYMQIYTDACYVP